MFRKTLSAICAIIICGTVQAKLPQKTIDALVSQYEIYYGEPLNVTDARKAKKATLSVPDYDRIFEEEHPDFIERNSVEAQRLDSAYNSIVVSTLAPKVVISECDSLLAYNEMVSPMQSSLKKEVVFTAVVEGTNKEGQKLTLYGDRKRVLLAVLEQQNDDGSWAVADSYEAIDFPYYTPKYRRQAMAFSEVNVALKKIDALRMNYEEMILEEERRAAEKAEREQAEAAALLERQLKNFKPDAAVSQATNFLKSQGHSVGTPRNVVNHGPRKVSVFADDFSRFTSTRRAAESQLPTLRRTLTQTKEVQRYSAASRETLKKNVRALIEQNDRTVRAYRNALARTAEKDIVLVTYNAGLVGEVSLYVNPDGSLNYLTWKDSSGKQHKEYPSLQQTMKVYDEMGDIIDQLKKFAAANP